MSASQSDIRAKADAAKVARTRDDPCTCKSLPECPECGGLQCLCRPRFFAGQLLTEEDLNRLERYIVEKNKLHNRYLHGSGVVCGLEVVCHPCPDRVTVRTGYALSPCGEDIVVCQDTVVNVCELIQKCRPATHAQECDPFHNANEEDCQDLVEPWVLAICYDEKPSRGITALRGSSGAACCSRCNCGGSSACGCSCHSQGTVGKKNSNGCHSTQRKPPPQCEPTVICEGYSFVAYKALPTNSNDRAHQSKGELTRRYDKCRAALTTIISSVDYKASYQEKFMWFQESKASLLDFFREYPTYDCSYLEKLNAITLEAPPVEDGNNKWAKIFESAATLLEKLVNKYLDHCFCSTLLPPCPPPVECNCVPLATIKVRRSDCHILEVCNWGPRRLVLTFPNLQYWLSPLGSQEALSSTIAKRCCAPFRDTEENPKVTSTIYLVDRNSSASVSESSPATSNNQFEFYNALPDLLLNQIIRPTFQGILPVQLANQMETLVRPRTNGSAEPPVSKKEDKFQKRLESLERIVKKQAAELAELRKNK